MMGLDFFRRSAELEREYARPGQRILNTIQTNGTLLDDEWGAFLKENNFLVGISVDGPPEMHDAYRVDKGGKPTFGRVMRGLEVLRRHEVDWNVLTTIHAVNGDHGRAVYTFLRDELGATFIQFIPIIERATEQTLPIADAGWGGGVEGRPLYTPGGKPGHSPLGRAGPVRALPDRRVRGVGPARHRDRLRPRCSTPRWPTSTASPAGCACTRKRAASSVWNGGIVRIGRVDRDVCVAPPGATPRLVGLPTLLTQPPPFSPKMPQLSG